MINESADERSGENITRRKNKGGKERETDERKILKFGVKREDRTKENSGG